MQGSNDENSTWKVKIRKNAVFNGNYLGEEFFHCFINIMDLHNLSASNLNYMQVTVLAELCKNLQLFCYFFFLATLGTRTHMNSHSHTHVRYRLSYSLGTAGLLFFATISNG